MATLTKEKKQELKLKLLKNKETIINQLSKIGIKDDKDGGGYRAYMKEDEDSGRSDEDNVSDLEKMEIKKLEEITLEKKLQKINDALDRIEFDDYGLCEDCGEEINIERISYDPTVKTCIKCANKQN